MPKPSQAFLHRHSTTLAFLFVFVIGAVIYLHDAGTIPAGSFIDESSVGYNAYLIAHSGHDEIGVAWPLYFRAFGEYKNPVYIYLLAALYRFTGPSISVARIFSATAGLIAALLIGILAFRITKQRSVAIIVMVMTLLMPWLFELSRVVVEVALYPLLLALFLWCVYRLVNKATWNWIDALILAATLALLTYTYSIGRLLAPMLALGLLFFRAPRRLPSILRVWVLYAVSIIPIVIFHFRHPGALRARFDVITYITPQTGYLEIVWEFVKHYAGNLNMWRMIVHGDPDYFQIAAIYGLGQLLLATFALALASLFLFIKRRHVDPWWRFVVYGLAVSFVPSSFTKDYLHTLRLAAVPMFLIILTLPAWHWLFEKKSRGRQAFAVTAIVLILAQGFYFQWVHRKTAETTQRIYLFDADYFSTILPLAVSASDSRPVYIAHTSPIPGYIQVLWYATLSHLPANKFVMLPPDVPAPDGGVVITTESTCPRCQILLRRDPYTLYIAQGLPRKLSPLPFEALRAELRPIDYPAQLHMRQPATVRALVRNIGNVTWLARERAGDQFQVNLGNHWLDRNGDAVANDDGRAPLMRDLKPGEEAEFQLMVNAPKEPGEYILEIDMLQEGVSWFGLRGSKTVRMPVRVYKRWFD